MSLAKSISELGGVAELADLPAVLGERLAPFDLLSREILKRHENVEFVWVDSPDFWAAAGMDDGRPTIAITYGTALAMKEAFLALFSSPELFTAMGEPSIEEPWSSPPPLLGVSTEVATRGAYWREPRAPQRARGAHLATSIAYAFVLNHELAHIRRSHVDLLDRPFMVDGPTPQEYPSDRMLEIDADFCAAVDTARSDLLSSRKGAEGPYVTAIFSIGMALSFLDAGIHVLDYESSAHAHPLHRLFIAVDALTVVLARRLGLDRPTAEHSRHKSYLLLLLCSEKLGALDSAFRNIEQNVWLTGEYQKERTRYLEWERDMMQSGRLSRVVGCPTELNLANWRRDQEGNRE